MERKVFDPEDNNPFNLKRYFNVNVTNFFSGF